MNYYNFYMRPTTRSGVASSAAKNLEEDYDGLKYVSCEGLEAVGEPKNIYTEDYAEQDGPRVFHPADVGGTLARMETDVKLTLLFIGTERRSVYESFVSFISAGRLFYWDTARHLKVWLLLQRAVEPDMDFLGDGGCIKAVFEFTNLWGIGRRCNDEGTLL